MSVPLYMDHHVPAAITEGVRRRGVDTRTAEEDGTKRLPDSELLDRATALGRVLFTQDRDLLIETARRQQQGITFAEVIYAPQNPALIGRYVGDLELLCLAGEPSDFADAVTYLPLPR